MYKEHLDKGQPFSMAAIREFVKNFKTQISKKTSLKEAFTDAKGEIREAEFFGRNKIATLLDTSKIGKEVLGIRVYYGLAPEDGERNLAAGGKLCPRLFLVPVGMDGKDLTFDTSCLKDGGDGDGLGGGAPQPPYQA